MDTGALVTWILGIIIAGFFIAGIRKIAGKFSGSGGCDSCGSGSGSSCSCCDKCHAETTHK